MTFPVEKQASLLSTRFDPLLHRHSANPILTARLAISHRQRLRCWPTLSDGRLLLCRVEDRRGLSHLCAARSRNGVDGWQIDRGPTLIPDPKNYPQKIRALKIPASHSSLSCSNTSSPTRPIHAVVLACRWR